MRRPSNVVDGGVAVRDVIVAVTAIGVGNVGVSVAAVGDVAVSVVSAAVGDVAVIVAVHVDVDAGIGSTGVVVGNVVCDLLSL